MPHLVARDPRSSLRNAVELRSARRRFLYLYPKLAQEGLELAVKLSSTVRVYDADLKAPKSNVIVIDTPQALRGIARLPDETDELVPREIVAAKLDESHVPKRGLAEGALRGRSTAFPRVRPSGCR